MQDLVKKNSLLKMDKQVAFSLRVTTRDFISLLSSHSTLILKCLFSNNGNAQSLYKGLILDISSNFYTFDDNLSITR